MSKLPKKTMKRESEAPTDDLSELYDVEKLRERKKKPSTYCKSRLRGLSLSLFLHVSMSLALFLLHAGPCPGSLWKMSGRGLAEDEGLWAEEGWEEV